MPVAVGVQPLHSGAGAERRPSVIRSPEQATDAHPARAKLLPGPAVRLIPTAIGEFHRLCRRRGCAFRLITGWLCIRIWRLRRAGVCRPAVYLADKRHRRIAHRFAEHRGKGGRILIAQTERDFGNRTPSRSAVMAYIRHACWRQSQNAIPVSRRNRRLNVRTLYSVLRPLLRRTADARLALKIAA